MPSDEDYKTMSVTRTHIYVSALQSYEFFPSHQNPYRRVVVDKLR